ncbi:glycosyltransferase [Thalassomonas viridans]|uniref:Glycosyltransferase n=1 Tax=Thalassomonas viridans TaxID=137584 RepID=A0AAE9Z3Z6_9GAMM|nr:glycosyltransferase [Thalassomonas viridans]WDE05645.1 glycosyltransferase [Thalassomonas viridans]
MKHVLIIGYVWPEPNSSAAGSRMMQLIAFFKSQQWAVTFASPAQRTEHMADLAAIGVDSRDISLNCQSFDAYIESLQPDIVMFDRFMMEEQFGWRVRQQCPQALTILDTEDLQFLRHARHQAAKGQREVQAQDYHSDLAKREVAAIFRCDLSLMISREEIELLTRRYQVDSRLLHYSPFMLERAVLSQLNPGYEQRQGFISIGNFRHAPNWDAVLWLKQQVWPLIRKALPQAQLFVYGAYPPPKATALHDVKSGFLVKGWVDDAIAAMQSARVCLAPLRFGAGLKGKLAEAMICNTPSVTTDIGAEGMQTDQAWGGAIANDAEAIAQAAVALYQQPGLWQESSIRGQENARQLFDRHQHFDALAEKIAQVSGDLSGHRQENFTGAMLNFHHHRSTQYMSQWIESKNKLAQLQEQQDKTLNQPEL